MKFYSTLIVILLFQTANFSCRQSNPKLTHIFFCDYLNTSRSVWDSIIIKKVLWIKKYTLLLMKQIQNIGHYDNGILKGAENIQLEILK